MEKMCSIFRLFSLSHFIYLFLAIGIAVGLIFVFRKVKDSLRKYVGMGLIVVAALFVVLDLVGKIMVVDNVFEYLPLNMCHIFVYICIYTEITKSSSWTKFGYLIVLPLVVLTMIFVPTQYTNWGDALLSVISYFFMNSVLISYVILRLIWNDEDIEKKDIINTTINFLIIIATVHIINVIFRFTVLGTEANYFGTMGENYDLVVGLISRLIPIPFVNLLPLMLILIGVEFLLILPFDVIKTKRDRQSQYEELVALGNLKAQVKYRKKNSSHVLVRGDNKAQPSMQKSTTGVAHKDGFVSINKEIQVNKDNSSND